MQQLYSHIASAIIPAASIVAVPSASQHFPQQKIRGEEEWGPMASTLLRASFTGQMLIPSSSSMTSLDQDQEDDRQRSKKRTQFGRMNASSDEDDTDEGGERTHRASSQKSVIKSVREISDLVYIIGNLFLEFISNSSNIRC